MTALYLILKDVVTVLNVKQMNSVCVQRENVIHQTVTVTSRAVHGVARETVSVDVH